MTLAEVMQDAPIIAIIRGVKPGEASAIAGALYEAGVRIVEAPLNSPDPLETIQILSREWGRKMICGAGTVLTVEKVEAVCAAGGKIVVSPDTRANVIRRACGLGLTPMPGFATASEMFQAYDCGARYLKLFPASTYGPGHVKALKAVAPPDATIMAVGGAGPSMMADWWAAGARGFGLGTDIYSPGQSPEATFEKASAAIKAVRALTGAQVAA